MVTFVNLSAVIFVLLCMCAMCEGAAHHQWAIVADGTVVRQRCGNATAYGSTHDLNAISLS
jgi:hypothetical protein